MSGAERVLLSVGAMSAAFTLAMVAGIGTALMLVFFASGYPRFAAARFGGRPHTRNAAFAGSPSCLLSC